MPDEKPLLLLFDANSLIHRAFHALPPLTTKGGEIVSAVYGFASMLLKVMNEVRPTYIAAAFDTRTPTFRHESYALYKAHRPAMPSELAGQFARVRALLEAFNIPIFELPGFEADDLLGALSKQAAESGIETRLVTGDADAMQLVGPQVQLLTPGRKGFSDTVTYDEATVRERYGVGPDQIADLKALKGDSSDNIPGVSGIGEKTAAKLIQQFHSLEGIYEHLDEVQPPKLRALLETNEEVARQSKVLATIVRDLPVTLDPERCHVSGYDRQRVVELFRELEFRSLLNKLPDGKAISAGDAPWREPTAREEPQQLSFFGPGEAAPEPEKDGEVGGGREPGRHEIVTSAEALDELIGRLSSTKDFALDTETTSTDAMRADLVGISLSLRPGEAHYIPVGHVRRSQMLLGAEPEEIAQLPREVVLRCLAPVLADPSIGKIGHNLKYDMIVLAEHGAPVSNPAFDSMIAAHLLNEKGLGLKDLAFGRLGVEMSPITDLIGKGAKQISMAEVPVDRAGAYACQDADCTLRLARLFERELRARGLWKLFNEIEMPLVPVLVEMERAGIALNTASLRSVSQTLREEMSRLERAIYEAVGHEFNINSTQQLAYVLFEELKLPSTRRTKSGLGSTEASVLEELRGVHDVIGLLLDWRQLSKLKSTYVDALPAMLNSRTGRLHTSFNQTGTSTGRLSSSEPNLQNIPVRTDLGRQVRQAFVAGRDGVEWLLLSADYSQIELRILAHITQDPGLLAAFRAGEDIHSATAARIFGTTIDQVTGQQRRLAKTINFGVIYGMSEYGLSERTELSRRQAAEFIQSYFARYPGVREYVESTRRRAREQGYVETLFGRRRYIPEINAPNMQLRQAAERMAINMPIQGTAADIIKVAMVALESAIHSQGLRSRMLLQVHDELVLEVPADEADLMLGLVRDKMESACQMDVKLEVEAKTGRNWGELD
ncbi:MAG: DNA polymerase I [Chloroflexota bacterium]|nr:MAG: DNA polymerase I [Chloroflexota bacterium]